VLFSLYFQKTRLICRTKFWEGYEISFRLGSSLLRTLFFYDIKMKAIIFMSLRFGHTPITRFCICAYSVHHFAEHSNLSAREVLMTRHTLSMQKILSYPMSCARYILMTGFKIISKNLCYLQAKTIEDLKYFSIINYLAFLN